ALQINPVVRRSIPSDAARIDSTGGPGSVTIHLQTGAPGLSRRRLLGFGLGAFVLPRPVPAAAQRRPARGLILVLLEGGMSQLETWAPKPAAPREVRGEFSTTATRLPGVRIGEHTPLMARELHRGNLLRAVHCDARNDHSPGLHLLLTGYE